MRSTTKKLWQGFGRLLRLFSMVLVKSRLPSALAVRRAGFFPSTFPLSPLTSLIAPIQLRPASGGTPVFLALRCAGVGDPLTQTKARISRTLTPTKVEEASDCVSRMVGYLKSARVSQSTIANPRDSERASYRRDGNRRCTPINDDGTGEHPRSSALIGGLKLSTAPLTTMAVVRNLT